MKKWGNISSSYDIYLWVLDNIYPEMNKKIKSMLGLLLLYWIGKYFYTLAEEYNKNQWGFAILGVVTYYGVTFLFGFMAGVIVEMISPGFLDDVNDMAFGIFMIPFGILSCYLLYSYLEKTWIKNKPHSNTFLEEVQ